MSTDSFSLNAVAKELLGHEKLDVKLDQLERFRYCTRELARPLLILMAGLLITGFSTDYFRKSAT